MQFHNKAAYLFRPVQILRRIFRTVKMTPPGFVEVQLPWGLSMKVNPRETIGRTIWNSGVHDLPVCEVLARLVAPGDVAVDVGANIGLMSGLMASCTGTSGKVFAFEAHPVVFQQLQSHLDCWKREPIAEIIGFQEAISSSAGTLNLVTTPEFTTNQGGSHILRDGEPNAGESMTAVSSRELVDALPPDCRVGVLKIDVEGHELDVLLGAAEMLRSGAVRDIVFEDAAGDLPRIEELLTPSGFSLMEIQWSLLGPCVRPVRMPVGQVTASDTELPNYIATREPGRATRLLAARGWRCLRPRHFAHRAT
jgi:FkbM family methyltransferase